MQTAKSGAVQSQAKNEKQFDVFIRLKPARAGQTPLSKKRLLSPTSGRSSSPFSARPRKTELFVVDNNSIQIENRENGQSTIYSYSGIFGGESTNKEIYESTCLPFIPNVLNCSMTWLAYGITGSGKTHTIFGSGGENGLYYLFLKGLKEFLGNESGSPGEELDELRDIVLEKGRSVEISASFIEIYNENIRDLFSKDFKEPASPLNQGISTYGQGGSKLLIVEDPVDGVLVKNANYLEVSDPNELAEHVSEGLRQRTTGIVGNHSYSSRSHAILSLHFSRKTPKGITTSTMQFVDLAGSEKLEIGNPKVAIIEGQNINRSLHALAQCINILADQSKKGRFIPFRNSKLTRLLKESLNGNTKSVMISCVHEDSSMAFENIMTLKYSAHAMAIKGRFGKLKEKNQEELAQYKQMVALMQKEISSLKGRLMRSNESTPGNTFMMQDNTMVDVIGAIEKKLKNFKTNSQQNSINSLFGQNKTPKKQSIKTPYPLHLFENIFGIFWEKKQKKIH